MPDAARALRAMSGDEPRHPESERAVCGALLVRGQEGTLRLADLEASRLSPEDFSEPKNEQIYRAIRDLLRAGRPVDVRTVQAWLEQHHLKAGLGYLSGLEGYLPDLERAPAYADDVRDAAARRRALTQLGALEQALRSGADPAAVSAALEAVSEAVRGAAPAPRAVALTLSEILDDPAALELPRVVVPRLAWEGRTTLLAGREKLGKSTLAGAMAAAVSRGGTFLGRRVEAGCVLWLLLEEHVGDLARRSIRFGADPSNVFVLDHPTAPLEDLGAAVRELRPALTIVDTLSSAVAGRIREAGSSTEWVPVLAVQEAIARETGTAIMILHHSRKSDGSYRDSTAIGAGVDVVAELHPVQGQATERRVRLQGRVPVEDFTVRYTGNDFELADGTASLGDRVFAYVAEHPECSGANVRQGVTGKDSEILQALARLVEDGRLEDVGTGQAHSYREPDPVQARAQVREQVDREPKAPVGTGGNRLGTGWEQPSVPAPCVGGGEQVRGAHPEDPQEVDL